MIDPSKKIRIFYLLSQKGMKLEILDGRAGTKLQTLDVPLTPELLEIGSVNGEGSVVLVVGFRPPPIGDVPLPIVVGYLVANGKVEFTSGIHEFDRPQTVDALVLWERARRACAEEGVEATKKPHGFLSSSRGN